ncbi:MAG: capsular biosynthesis protein [Bacilli bacterium]
MNSIIFDIDGTICPIKKEEEKYEDLVPFPDMVSKIRELKKDGYKIVLFTARNMRTYNGNIDLILKNTKPILEKWLSKWEIPYDEIIFGKPYPGKNGFYVDDRTIRPNELLNLTKEEINELIGR